MPLSPEGTLWYLRPKQLLQIVSHHMLLGQKFPMYTSLLDSLIHIVYRRQIIPNILKFKNKLKNTTDGKSNFQNIKFFLFTIFGRFTFQIEQQM